MKPSIAIQAIVLILTILMSNLTWAQSAERGIEKYNNADYAGALKEFQTLAAKGHAKSQSWLGFMYYNGKGVKQDYCKAAELYQKAVNGDWLEAYPLLGDMYLKGQCLEKDYDKAFALFQKGAHKGNGDSLAYLGQMYRYGMGVEKNIDEAKDLFRLCVKKSKDWGNWCASELNAMSYQGILGKSK